MAIIETLNVDVQSRTKVLRIVAGDIVDHAAHVDLVIIPAGGQVASAFARRGMAIPPFERALSNQRVEKRSSAKLEGVRYKCWIIDPPADDQRFRVCAFLPVYFETIVTAYRYLFESLVQLVPSTDLADTGRIRDIALPVLLSGDAGIGIDAAAPHLIRGMIHWLALGLPFERVDFVLREQSDALRAADILRRQVSLYRESPIGSRPQIRHDVFISYSHQDKTEADWISRKLRELSPTLRVFQDATTLRVGAIWQHALYLALDSSRHVLALLSPHYIASEFCIEEFNIVIMRDRQEGSCALFPVLLESVSLPRYMQLRQSVDCKPRDRAKLTEMCETLVHVIEVARSGDPLQ